jgi:hypothetical protein
MPYVHTSTGLTELLRARHLAQALHHMVVALSDNVLKQIQQQLVRACILMLLLLPQCS